MSWLENIRQKLKAKRVEEDLDIEFKKIHELLRANDKLNAKLSAVTFLDMYNRSIYESPINFFSLT